MQEVSAKTICRYVSRHHFHQSQQDLFSQKQAEPQPEAKPVKRTGAGGPWRAFVSERSKGMKLTRVGFKSLSAEYRALSVEEYQHYKQLGALMTLHSKLNRDASVTKHHQRQQ